MNIVTTHPPQPRTPFPPGPSSPTARRPPHSPCLIFVFYPPPAGKPAVAGTLLRCLFLSRWSFLHAPFLCFNISQPLLQKEGGSIAHAPNQIVSGCFDQTLP